MKLAVIGTGYVGLPVGTGFAELGHDVTCIDSNPRKIEGLKAGKPFLFEEGLDELFQKNIANGRLKFTSSKEEGVTGAEVVMLAVGTPQDPLTNRADLQYIYAAARELAPHIGKYTVVATKSTVPVGTNDEIERIIRETNPTAHFDVVSIPEFLREGFAIHDFFHPDRIVFGTQSPRAKIALSNLYSHFIQKPELKDKIFFVGRRSAELAKYAANSFLAIKIGFANAMADLCEQGGANVLDVMRVIGADTRIGPKFLNPGIAFGGSCFPKDTNALVEIGKIYGVQLDLIKTTIEQNEDRKKEMAERIVQSLGNIENPRIAILGLAFKGGTDDCRQSPAMDVLGHLLEAAKIGAFKGTPSFVAYDPQALENAKGILGNKIQYADSAMHALQGADTCAILTEWDEFKNLDLNAAKNVMRHNHILDLRNMLSREEAVKLGFTYAGIGHPSAEVEQALKEKYGKVFMNYTRYGFRDALKNGIAGEYVEFLGHIKPTNVDTIQKAAALSWHFGRTVIDALEDKLGTLPPEDIHCQNRIVSETDWIYKKMVDHPARQQAQIDKLFADPSMQLMAKNVGFKSEELPELMERLKITTALQDIGHLSGVNMKDGTKFNPVEIISRVALEYDNAKEEMTQGNSHGIISAEIVKEIGIENPQIILPIKYHDKKDATTALKKDAEFNQLPEEEQKRILFISDVIRTTNKLANLQEYKEFGISKCAEMNDPNYSVGPVSPAVLSQFYNKTTINSEETVTYLDTLLKFASWGFELPFKVAQEQFKNEIFEPLFGQIEKQAATEQQKGCLNTLKTIQEAKSFMSKEINTPPSNSQNKWGNSHNQGANL